LKRIALQNLISISGNPIGNIGNNLNLIPEKTLQQKVRADFYPAEIGLPAIVAVISDQTQANDIQFLIPQPGIKFEGAGPNWPVKKSFFILLYEGARQNFGETRS